MDRSLVVILGTFGFAACCLFGMASLARPINIFNFRLTHYPLTSDGGMGLPWATSAYLVAHSAAAACSCPDNACRLVARRALEMP